MAPWRRHLVAHALDRDGSVRAPQRALPGDAERRPERVDAGAGPRRIDAVEQSLYRRRAELAVNAAVVVLLDPGDGGIVERLQGERLDAFKHGHQAALDRGPQDLHLAVLIRGSREGRGVDDAEPVQPLLDLAGDHRRAVVAHQGARQAALHEGLAEPVDEDLGGLRQIPLQVAAEPRAVVEEAEQDRRPPFAGRRQHAALAVVEVAVPEAVAARDLVAQHLARLGRRPPRLLLEAPPPALATRTRLRIARSACVTHRASAGSPRPARRVS